MSDTYDIENNGIDGEDEVGSINHSLAQAKIAGMLINDDKLSVMTELSLDISQYDLSKYKLKIKDEFKPDVCAYLKRPVIPDGENDLLRVSQMPDLAIEILSPRQAVSYLVRKIKAYFELGVRSAWLVNPDQKIISVYSSPNDWKTFGREDIEIIDELMDIRLPIQKVF